MSFWEIVDKHIDFFMNLVGVVFLLVIAWGIMLALGGTYGYV